MTIMDRHGDDLDEGRIVSLFRFAEPWISWEMHPAGDEVVCVVQGHMILHQELPDGGTRATSSDRANMRSIPRARGTPPTPMNRSSPCSSPPARARPTGRGEAARRGEMVLPVRIELTTSALPRMRSTTELRQHFSGSRGPMATRPVNPRAVKEKGVSDKDDKARNGSPRRCARICAAAKRRRARCRRRQGKHQPSRLTLPQSRRHSRAPCAFSRTMRRPRTPR